MIHISIFGVILAYLSVVAASGLFLLEYQQTSGDTLENCFQPPQSERRRTYGQ